MEKFLEFVKNEAITFCNNEVIISIINDIDSPKIAISSNEKQVFFKNFEEYYSNIISPLNYVYNQSIVAHQQNFSNSKEYLFFLETLIGKYSFYFNEIALSDKKLEINENTNFDKIANTIFKGTNKNASNLLFSADKYFLIFDTLNQVLARNRKSLTFDANNYFLSISLLIYRLNFMHNLSYAIQQFDIPAVHTYLSNVRTNLLLPNLPVKQKFKLPAIIVKPIFPNPGPDDAPNRAFPFPPIFWIDKWFIQMLRCLSAAYNYPLFRIDDIFNISKNISRKGCRGDLIEIRGENLGEGGEVSLGGVIADTNWTDTLISFYIPNHAPFVNNLSIHISIHVGSVCDNIRIGWEIPVRVGRIEEPQNNYSFELLEEAIIDNFGVVLNSMIISPSSINGGMIKYYIEACKNYKLQANYRNAESILITKLGQSNPLFSYQWFVKN